MTVRPAARRRLVTVEELVDLLAAIGDVELEPEEIERHLRGLGPSRASWGGSGWRLSDPAWKELLGEDALAKLNRAHTLGTRRYANSAKALQRAGGLYGEDVEVEL